jgi:hypothetical protein
VAKKNKKDKKVKKAARKADKKINTSSKASELVRKAGETIVSHPAVAEVVAATLVAAAAALKNPKKAQALAIAAGDDLQALTKEAAAKGSALWALALEVGRKSLETFDLAPAGPAARRKPAARKAPAVRKAPAARKASAGRKPAARKPSAARRTTPKKG